MTLDIRDYYEQMNACKKYLDALPNRKRTSQKTREQYVLDFKRMLKNGDDPLTLCTTKNTFYKYRAAWNFVYEDVAKNNHKKASKEKDKAKKIIFIKRLIIAVNELKRFPPDPTGENFKLHEKGQYSSNWQEVKDKAPPSKSKKSQVTKLPKDWRERYFSHVSEKRSKYTSVIALMAITGCRPAEMEGGITIYLQPDRSIKVSINGKKTHDGKYGQAVREFVITSEGIEYEHLVGEMGKNNNKLSIQVESAKALGEQMRKYSKKAFPRMKSIISPYTYRHNFAKNLKATLSSKVDIAVAMGHSNDKSQRYYANGGKDGGGFKIDQIEGTREVKQISQNSGFDPEMLANDNGIRM